MGFRVWGLGFRVSGSGFRVQGQGSGFRVITGGEEANARHQRERAHAVRVPLHTPSRDEL